MRRMLLALSLAAVACAASPRARWVAASASAPGHCLVPPACHPQDHECTLQRDRETVLCQLDRARMDAPDRGAVPVFDELALLLLSPVGQCGDQRSLFSDSLLALYPAVQARVDEAFAANQIDLASQRARLLLHVVPTTDAAAPWSRRLGDVISRAQDIHRREHLRLTESLPGAALFHHQQLDHRDDQGLPALELRDRVRQLFLYRHNYQVTVQTAAGCEEALVRVTPGSHRLSGTLEPPASVDLEVSQCTEVRRREPIQVSCEAGTIRRPRLVPRIEPQPPPIDRRPAPTPGRTPPREDEILVPLPSPQPPVQAPPMMTIWEEEPVLRTVTASRLTAGYKLHASWRLNGAAPDHPGLDVSVLEQTLELPTGCVLMSHVPLESFSRDGGDTAKSVAYRRLSEQFWSHVHEATRVPVTELRIAARQASGLGDLDRADHFHQLVLAALGAPQSPYAPPVTEPDAGAATDEAEAWFSRRYGTRTRRDPRIASRFVATPIGLVFELHAYQPFADPRDTRCGR